MKRSQTTWHSFCWIAAIASPLSGCLEPQNADEFLEKNFSKLSTAIALMREGRIADRLANNEDYKQLCENEMACITRSESIAKLMNEIDVNYVSVEDQCFEIESKCSIRFGIFYKGIAVSGSSRELIYDVSPNWGTFRIMRTKKEKWYWRDN